MPNLVNIFKISTEKSLVDKLICTINILLVDEDRSVLEQRPILEYCNASINHIIQVNVVNCFILMYDLFHISLC
jgi:hypothetical protein